MLNKIVIAIPATQTGKLVWESPKTQSIDALKALLAFKKVACNPLPQEFSLDDGPGQPCKHSMKYFPQQKREAPREQGDLGVTLPGPVEAI